MAFIYEINGKRVEFDKEPSEADIDEAARQLGGNKQSAQEKPKGNFGRDVLQALTSPLGPVGGMAVNMASRRMTPETQTGYPEEQFLASAVNTAGLGIPQAAVGAMGGQYPQPQTGPEQLGAMGGGVAGMMAPGGLATKGAGMAIKGAGLGMKLLRGVAAGGALGGAMSPQVTNPDETFADMGARTRNAVVGGILGALAEGGIAAGQKVVGAGRKLKNSAEILNKIGEEVAQIKTAGVNKFASQLDDLSRIRPNAKTSAVRGMIDEIKMAQTMDPGSYTEELKLFKKLPNFQRYWDSPELAENMTAGEIQKWINHINLPANIKASTIGMLEFKNDLRAAQLEAFPEMEGIRQEYAKMIEPYNKIKSQFRFGKIHDSIMSNFKDPQSKALVENLLPKETLKSIGGYKGAVKTMEKSREILDALLKTAAVTAVGGAVAGTALKLTK